MPATSEAKPRLHFDDACAQRLLSLPKMPVARRCPACRDVGLEIPKVKDVRQVVEVSSEFDICVFSEQG